MDQQPKKALNKTALDALNKTALDYFRSYDFGMPSIVPDEAFSKALLKHFGEYGSPYFLVEVANQTFRQVLRKRLDIFPKSGKANSHFSDDALREAATAVVDVFVAPPRTYLYYFPMPVLFGQYRGRISVTPEIFFEEFPVRTEMVFHEARFDLSQPRSEYGFTHTLSGSTVYLGIKTRGLFLPDEIYGPTAEAISTVKQLLLLSELSSGALTRHGFDSNTKTRTGFVVDEGLGLEHAAPLLLPETLSTALDGWNHWPWDQATADDLEEHELPAAPDGESEREITADELGIFLRASLRLGLRVINSKTQKTEDLAPGVLTASSWAFDSLYEGNMGARVLFLGIAFEALLGNPKEVITKTLADRLAYLIGTSHRERDAIRDDFTAFYQLRSNVAHGEAQRLSWDDTLLYSKAFSLFKRALKHEVSVAADK